jgi:putative cardiolipin synthase
MGVVIDSRVLAQRLGDAFDTLVPQIAYEVRLGADGQKLEWIERTASGELRHDTEPDTSWFSRAKIEMLSWLPIEWLL